MDNNNCKKKIDELAAELELANKDLLFQNEEKAKRAAELELANKELSYQNEEKAKRAAELELANKELSYQNEEKAKRAAELELANKELLLQNEEKAKRAAELELANKELLFQNEEKAKRAAELLVLKDVLYIEKQFLEKTMMSIGDAVISADINSNIIFLNRAAEEVTGWTFVETMGISIYEVFNVIDGSTRKKAEDIIKKVMISKNTQVMTDNTLLITKDKKEIWIEDSAAPILDEKNVVLGVVVIFRDVTEKLKQLKKIKYLSLHDKLTGLYNRRFYEEELKLIDTKRNLPISLIMGDVNGLKLINDSFGHNAGDQALVKTAKAIKKGCRSDDVIARIGGDEFIIILTKSDSKETQEIIERIQSNMALEFVEGINVSVSFGYCTKSEYKQSIMKLFKVAEDSMYKHKLYESTSMRSKTIGMISSTLFAKSSREQIHSKRVSDLCEAICIKMGFEDDVVERIKLAGLMHDIGKIGVKDEILNKMGGFSNQEYELMKRHAEIGYRILSSLNDFSEIAEYVLEHHENWDGTGYPQGLKGEEIKIEARIIRVADSYAARTNQRPYGTVLSSDEAILEIKRCCGTQFEPNIARIFIEEVVNKI